jgi:hypothetical protein
MALTKVQLNDTSLSLMQDSIGDELNKLGANPLNGGRVMKSVALVAGQNNIGHGLGRAPTGWAVIRQHSTVNAIDWTQATLGAGWAHSGEPVQYRMDALGQVTWRGYATTAAPVAAGTTPIASMPSAVLPISSTTAHIRRPVCYGQSGGVIGLFRHDINAAGTWTMADATVAIGTMNFLLFDSVTWKSWTPPSVAVADVQDLNPNPDRTLWLSSSGPATVDLLVF